MGTVSIGGTSFDIYGTLAAANTYMNARLGAESWSVADATNKSKALVSATRFVDRQNWQSQKVDIATPQALEFPRTGLIDKDGIAVSELAVPVLVEEATYEMALSILADATVTDNASAGSNVKLVKAGTAEVRFFRQTTGSKLPTAAHELIGLWLEGGLTSASTGSP